MRFSSSPSVNHTPSVLPLLGVSLLPAALVLAMACLSLSHEEQSLRLPTTSLPRPARIREMPAVAVRLSPQGEVMIGGQTIAGDALAAAWQRERGALQLLGFEPAQAMVVIRADRNVPTDKVQQLIETAQECGFGQCVLRPAEPVPGAAGDNLGVLSKGPKP